MEVQDNVPVSRRSLLRSSARLTAFWTFVAAIVGVIAIAAGGITYLSIDEIRGASITVLIIGFVLLFVALVLSPRTVAVFLAGRQGRYGANVVVMTVAFFAIAVLVNFLLFRSPSRFDLTATRIFTLAPQTVEILRNLEGPVRANAFFTPTDPVGQQTEDLLNEFDRRSGKFSYRFIDPELNRSLAEQYNVAQYPAIVFEDRAAGTRQGITVFNEQNFVTGILVATGKEQKRVYILSGHKESGMSRDVASGEIDDQGFDFAIQGMQRDNYVVLPLNLGQRGRVPPDAAVLVIAGPQQDLAPPEVEALNDYLKSGGAIVGLFDPGTPDTFTNLVGPWGIALGRYSIADAVSNVGGQLLTPLIQRANIQIVPTGTGGITDQLDVTFFPEVASVERALPAEDMPPHIRFTRLALTTPASWLVTDPENVNFQAGQEENLGPFSVAASVRATGTTDDPPDLVEEPRVAKLVVFGDSDFARNKFFYSSDNADFLLNSVNWLAEDYDLISIRPKVVPFRELVVTTRERDFIKWSSWFLPPSLMFVLGAFVWWRRR